MVVSNQLKNQHLLWRAGFGPLPQNREELIRQSQKSLWKAMLKDSSGSFDYIDVAGNMFKGLMMGVGDAARMQKELAPDQKKQFRKQSRQDIKNLNLAWLNEMVNSPAQLREKTALFWHGHFASRNLNIFYQQLLLEAVRKNALGSFEDLLYDVSKSAAMINFLNNNQNKKDHPNENFAREVMELFTLGRGHYTEQDVKESARAFTGWGADIRGEFVFRRGQHDDGVKTILGQTGRFDGDDVLHILLEQKQTAAFITRKIYRYFVNDSVDETHLAWLADRFYQSRYHIGSLLEDIFTSDWFYDAKNIGARIKSPVDLLVGIRRMLPMEIENPEVQLMVQRLLGQLLFYPPNVAGWPGGTSWIDSSSLMFRLRIPQMLYASDEFHLHPKDDDDQMMGMHDNMEETEKIKGLGKIKTGHVFQTTIQWDAYLDQFKQVSKENLSSEISDFLLQRKSDIRDSTLKQYVDSSSHDAYIKSSTIRLMSTPEYQLC